MQMEQNDGASRASERAHYGNGVNSYNGCSNGYTDGGNGYVNGTKPHRHNRY